MRDRLTAVVLALSLAAGFIGSCLLAGAALGLIFG